MISPTQTLRVCHLLPSTLTQDGPSNVLLSLLQNLRQTSIESSVWSMYAPPKDRCPSAAILATGAKYRELGMSQSFLDPRVLPPLVASLRQAKPDVLQCHLVRASLYGRIAAAIAGIPCVICVAHSVEEYMTSDNLRDRLVRRAESATQSMVTRYVAVSDAVSHALRNRVGISPERICTIRNGISLGGSSAGTSEARREARARMGLSIDDLVVGTVARLLPRKRQHDLLRSIAALSHHVAHLKCVIVGDGEARPKLESLVKELQLESAVTLLGHRPDVSELLPGFDVFALTSSHEGLPVALLEAMRAGLPAVVTRAGGIAEAVADGDSGFVVEIADVPGLAAALNTLLLDGELRQRFGASSRRRADQMFSAEAMAATYADLYTRVAKERLKQAVNSSTMDTVRE